MPTGVTGYTARNVPYFDDTLAAAQIGDGIVAITNWINAHPGISVETTTTRNALAGADLWDGRIVWNQTTLQLEKYDAGSATWKSAGITLDTTASHITAIARGNAASAGAIGLGTDAGHVHPWVDTDTTVEPRHALVQRIDQRQVALTYTSGVLTSVVEKDSTGVTTVKTTTLTYTSGVLTSVAETQGGHTVTTTLTYTSGVLTSVTRAYV